METHMEAFVDWQKCRRGGWCFLSELDLAHNHFDDMAGVYVIWYQDENENPVCLKVGEGFIRDCLIEELYDQDLQAHRQKQELFVTWAKVGPPFCSCVVKYVIEALEPELRCTCPDAEAIEVNLPWQKATSLPWE
jgi:hypothetical protein